MTFSSDPAAAAHNINPYAPPRSNVEGVELESSELELADRGTRLGASLLDTLISGLPAVALIWGVLAWLGFDLLRPVLGGLSGAWVAFLAVVIAAGVTLAINGYLLVKYGQTVGKRLCRIRIVCKDGTLPTLWDSFGKRQLPIMLLGQIPVVGRLVAIVDVLFIFRQNRLCLHDNLAGTMVVKAPRVVAVINKPQPVPEVVVLPKTPEVPAPVVVLELCPYCAEPTSEFANTCRGCGRNPFVVDGQTANRTLTAEELQRKAARLYEHGLPDEALAVQVAATRFHPHQRSAWLGLQQAPNAEPGMQAEAQLQLERIEQILHG